MVVVDMLAVEDAILLAEVAVVHLVVLQKLEFVVFVRLHFVYKVGMVLKFALLGGLVHHHP